MTCLFSLFMLCSYQLFDIVELANICLPFGSEAYTPSRLPFINYPPPARTKTAAEPKSGGRTSANIGNIQPATAAATSAAKSLASFSMPSPSWKRT